jgi:hypothetical protein
VWPYSITVGLTGKAVAVGTDAPEVLGRLEPWRIDHVGEPYDYCLELHPQDRGSPGQPRRLPGLYHGSTALLRSRDTARLTTTFLRVLSSHGRPAGERQVRLALMPIVCDGVALLAPPATIATVSDRWLVDLGIEAIHTMSTLVDAVQGTVLIDPPLGDGAEPRVLPFGAWWLPYSGSEGELSPGFAVAESMTVATNVTAGNAAWVLQAVAMLVERDNPAFAPATPDAVKDALNKILQRAATHEMAP